MVLDYSSAGQYAILPDVDTEGVGLTGDRVLAFGAESSKVLDGVKEGVQ